MIKRGGVKISNIEKRIVKSVPVYKYFWNCTECNNEVSSDREPVFPSQLICNNCRRRIAEENKKSAKRRYEEWITKAEKELIGAKIIDIEFTSEIDLLMALVVELEDGSKKYLEAYEDYSDKNDYAIVAIEVSDFNG